MSELFRSIEGYSRYSISESGQLYDHKLERYIRPIFKKGYYALSLVNDQLVRKNVSRHRLVALAFIPNDDPINKVHVNHKNGIKGSDHYSNLEWSTVSQNRQHAVDNGLTVVNKTVSVIDECGEECLYVSIKAVARELNIDYLRLKRLLSDEDIVVIGSNTIKLVNSSNNNGKTKVVWRSLITGESGEFESIVKASEVTGVSVHSIHNRLAYPDGVIHKDGFQFVRKREFSGWTFIKDFDKAYNEQSWEKKVSLKWLDSDEVIEFDNQTEVAKFLDLSTAKISQSLNDNQQPVVRHSGRYALLKRKSNTDTWRKVKNPLVEYSKSQGFKPIVVTSVSGEKQFFVSTKECADTFGIGITTLNWRLKKPDNVYDGFTFDYLNS